MYELLRLLEQNARFTEEELAAMLALDEEAVRDAIEQYKKDGILCGYTAIVDWDKTDREFVSARIELKVTPKKDRGFDEIAEQISQYEEVRSLCLMSGGYDLALTVVGRTFRDIASFVSTRLATLDSVQSTATHFILRRYKDSGVTVDDLYKDERGVVL